MEKNRQKRETHIEDSVKMKLLDSSNYGLLAPKKFPEAYKHLLI